jgi:hypothetical protein
VCVLDGASPPPLQGQVVAMTATDYADVVLGDRPGFLAVAFGHDSYRDDTGKYKHRTWTQRQYPWPTGRDALHTDVSRMLAAGERVDVYVCPAVRFTDDRRKGSALPPMVCWVDLDCAPADPGLFADLDPFVVESGSDGHRHGYVPLSRPVDLGTHARLNQALAAKLGGDAKWSDESLLRLPGTLNHKTDPPTVVTPRRWSGRVWDPVELAALLGVETTAGSVSPGGSSSQTAGEAPPDPLPKRVLWALEHPGRSDRSAAHHRLIRACRDAGLSEGQALSVAMAYPPSTEKYGARLAEEVHRSYSAPGGRKGADSEPPQDAEDEPLRVVPFPVLDPAALYGLAGKIIQAVSPYTEAHPAAMLVQLLAYFGAVVGTGPHIVIGNRQHAARLYPLIVGKTSDGAKGTSYEVVRALFTGAESRGGRDPIRRVSGLSSGEGLIEAIRDGNGSDPDAKGFDEGVPDKRLLVVEQEFTSMLAVMKREGSILPRVVREAWDGEVLRTMKRSPMVATGAHIVIVGHVTPGEFRLRLKDVAQLVGGTLNRFPVVASRRTKLLSDGGNIPPEMLEEYGTALADAVAGSASFTALQRTPEADELWRQCYAGLRRARPDGPVAQILARCAPQVLRFALAYALSTALRPSGTTTSVPRWRSGPTWKPPLSGCSAVSWIPVRSTTW